ncbi:SPFH domain-containing protein [Bartonella sp. HY329]|uniref:SPFH domain-containing protein n=1 Tax=unclassified Bartonella TaxID=2645622 RepID=UPI0021C6568E|nr:MULTISPECIES: SPFH domain-containing protein [unclassified Bartonella]UXM94566.1 SPFH domain-containing protein [Bartonella sp. HY329]UXN08890.1 SPFH domain-containing protein [Bartonella sp. HY328]
MKRFLKNQLATVIQWGEPHNDVLWWKFPHDNDEIKNASKLIVAPGQGCILVYEGKVIDKIEEPGLYNLKTSNHPFITSLLKIRQFFESEHKLQLYFYQLVEIANQSWGTAEKIKYIDPVYKFPVQLGLFGIFNYRITNASSLMTNLISNDEMFTTDMMRQIFVAQLQTVVASHIAAKKIAFVEIDAELVTLSNDLKALLQDEFESWGISLVKFKINGTAFDEESLANAQRIGQLAADQYAASQAGLDYVQLEKIKAMRDAAKNEGGLAGVGLQFGIGMQMGRDFNTSSVNTSNEEPMKPMEALEQLKKMFDNELLSAEEYHQKRQKYLDLL